MYVTHMLKPQGGTVMVCRQSISFAFLTFLINNVVVRSETELRVQISLWDIYRLPPPESLERFLGFDEFGNPDPDIIAVGLQNCTLKNITPTKIEEESDRIKCGRKELRRNHDWINTREWGSVIESILEEREYYRVGKREMYGTALAIYAKNARFDDIRVTYCPVIETINELFPEMGAVALFINVFNKPIAFVSAQLAAHIRNEERRKEDYLKIFEDIFKYKKDAIFLFGSLNLNDDRISTANVYRMITPPLTKRIFTRGNLKEGLTTSNIKDPYVTYSWKDRVLYKTYDPNSITIFSTFYNQNIHYEKCGKYQPIDALYSISL